MDEKKYPVLYYDLEVTNVDLVKELSDQLSNYFEREKIPFIFLPKDVMTLKLLTKEEALHNLKGIIKEVESWK